MQEQMRCMNSVPDPAVVVRNKKSGLCRFIDELLFLDLRSNHAGPRKPPRLSGEVFGTSSCRLQSHEYKSSKKLSTILPRKPSRKRPSVLKRCRSEPCSRIERFVSWVREHGSLPELGSKKPRRLGLSGLLRHRWAVLALNLVGAIATENDRLSRANKWIGQKSKLFRTFLDKVHFLLLNHNKMG